jgi:hypothetical protein
MAVAEAVITITRADTMNGKMDKPSLYGNTFNHLLTVVLGVEDGTSNNGINIVLRTTGFYIVR